MRARCALAVLWVAACNEPSVAPRSAPRDASSSSTGLPEPADAPVSVYAVVDLPASALTHSLSALTSDGQTFFALPDKRPSLVTLTPNVSYTQFAVAQGISLAGESTSDWDGEGLTRASDGSFYLVANETTPRLVHVSAAGEALGELAVPPEYADQPRTNKGLESLSITPSGAFLFSANEAALTRDGPLPSKSVGSVVRLLRLPLTGSGAAAEYAYRTEPLGAGTSGDMGVSDVLAVSDDSMLVLERGYQPDFGNTVRVFQVSVARALDVSTLPSLGAAPPVVDKQLVIDIATLPPGATRHPSIQPNPLLDNYEGLTFGPTLPDGRRLLLLLSDDNGKSTQVARILVLAVRSL